MTGPQPHPSPHAIDYSFDVRALKAARLFALSEPRQFDRIVEYLGQSLEEPKLRSIDAELGLAARVGRGDMARLLALGLMAGQIAQLHNQSSHQEAPHT